MDRHAHWQNIYTTRSDLEVSWYQPTPTVSLELIRKVCPRGRVVDIGGGASRLVDHLLDGGDDVTVVDIAEAALAKSQARLGPRGSAVRWVAADILRVENLGTFDVWHDRAVFHFLTDAEERRRYAELAARSVVPGGHVIIGTFAADGPPRCSGLDVRRYDAACLAAEFTPHFQMVNQMRHEHVTPQGKTQAFTFVTLRRAGG